MTDHDHHSIGCPTCHQRAGIDNLWSWDLARWDDYISGVIGVTPEGELVSQRSGF